MWVAGEACPNPSQCSGQIFQNTLSSSFVETENKYDITYGVGYVEGNISVDQFSFVPSPAPDQIATEVNFLMVYMAKDMTAILADGLLGLAPNAPPDFPTKTLL
jgi:hypothetical protein